MEKIEWRGMTKTDGSSGRLQKKIKIHNAPTRPDKDGGYPTLRFK